MNYSEDKFLLYPAEDDADDGMTALEILFMLAECLGYKVEKI